MRGSGAPASVADCRSCGAPVIWTVTERGKRMPVDARRDGVHLDRGECGPWPLNGPRWNGSFDEIDCAVCRVVARSQFARGEHPGWHAP